jgi:pyridoxine kinase
MIILSIQSHVAYGHVGNSAAVFPLQRIGVDVWPVNTVQYSNHTGYGKWRGRTFSAEAVRLIVVGIEEHGVLAECDGVLSGYLGAADIGEAVVESVGRVKAANPAARYCCDPVIGDVASGIFVRAGVPEFIKERAIAIADIVTPNQFELDYLTGRRTATIADAIAAFDMLHEIGPRVVLATSMELADTPADSIDILVSADGERHRVRTPKLPIVANGAGDAMAALFFAHYLRLGSAPEACALAASSLFGVLSRTAEVGATEMLLVEAQDQFVKPSRRFRARPVGR